MYRNYADNVSLKSCIMLEISCFKLENLSKKSSLRKRHLKFKSYIRSTIPAFTD